MNKAGYQKYIIIILTVFVCAFMAIIETVVEPTYAVKSAIKVGAFLILPLIVLKVSGIRIFGNAFSINGKILARLLLLGIFIYLIIMGAYALTGMFFDYSTLVRSLSEDQKVDGKSFAAVSLYISFCNSLLEEFLFRQISFVKLSEYSSKKAAYIFSSAMFAIYHVAIIGTSFPLPLMLPALLGLFAGGVIFDYANAKGKNIYNSWIIHMFADFAIMTVWYIHL